MPSGKFRISVHTNFKGYHTVTPTTFTRTWSVNPTTSGVTSSFIGGKTLTLTGAGFINSQISNNEIFVCGLKSKITTATAT